MKKFIVDHYLALLYLLLLSCIPLLWYQPGTIAIGHDTGWSMVPLDRFIDRLFTWTRVGFGYDQSLDLGVLTIYSIPALLQFLGLPIAIVQKLTFIFWFFAMSCAMYYLSQTVYRGKYWKEVALLAATFYVLNHYTLQAWGVTELSKFSAMTIFPIVLANLWRVMDNRMSILRGASLTAIFFFFFNGGGGSGIPLYGGMLITLALFFVYTCVIEKLSFIKLIKTYVVFSIFIGFVNCYWIIPLIDVVKSQYSLYASSGGPTTTLAWTDVISRNASILNLFRLQGFSSWYDTPNHPYASYFLKNVFFIMLSYVFPIIVFSSLLLGRVKEEKKVVLFFVLLALLAIIFTAGTHAPFGSFYAILMTKVYGFAIFRTAFYKFGYALWFSYAFLFAFSLVRIANLLKKELLVRGIIFLGFILIGAYNFPFFTGSFFNIIPPFKTMVALPEYIVQAQNYIQTLPPTDRILLVPPPSPTNGQSDIYTFDYFSRTPLPFEVTQKSIVTNVEINTNGEEKLTEALYSAIQKHDQVQVRSLLSMLGIQHILVRKDVMTKNKQYRVAPPQDYVRNLRSYTWILPEKTFGAWEFYKIKNASNQVAVFPPHVVFTTDTNASQTAADFDPDTLVVNESFSHIIPSNGSHTIFAHCETCDNKVYTQPTDSVFLPTSPLYFLVTYDEKKKLTSSLGNPLIHLGFDLFFAERHALEIKQLIDLQKGRSKELFDQQQRYTILQSYESLFHDARKTYSQLSTLQKLTVVEEVQNSLIRQREFLRPLAKSTFMRDIDNYYYHIYNLLDSFITDPSVRDILSERKRYFSYSVDISQEGNYVIHETSNTATESGVIIDGVDISSNAVHLTKGEHVIHIKKPQRQNIIHEQEFNLSPNTTKSLPLVNLEKNQLYTVSFQARSQFTFNIKVIDDFGNYKLLQIVGGDPSDSYNDFSFNFTTESVVSKPYILQFSNDNTLQVRNLSVSKLSYPSISFTAENTSATSSYSAPSVKTIYKSPTSYTVHIAHASQPYILLFKQTFSPFWIASIDNAGPVSNHFSAYDGFNGWYIDKKGDYTITLQFQVQKYYLLGKVVSGITVLVLFVIVFLPKRKGDQRKGDHTRYV